MIKLVYIFVIAICASKAVICTNILFLQTDCAPSHHLFIRHLGETLAKTGHNVTFLMTSASIEIGVSKLDNLTFLWTNEDQEDKDMQRINHLQSSKVSMIDMSIGWQQHMIKKLDDFRSSKGYRQLLAYPDDFEFDLILYDCTTVPIFLGFHQKFGQPSLIGFSIINGVSSTNYATGSLFYPSYIPFFYNRSTKNSFLDRTRNFLILFYNHYYRKYYSLPIIQNILKEDFPDLPQLSEIEEKTKIVLVNYSPVIHDPEPILPSVIPVAGMHIKDPKPLTEEFEKIVNSSKNGLILFTLGTNVKTWMLEEDRIRKLLQAFKELPQYNFLWKFDDTTIDTVVHEIPNNVFIKKWLPQNDILAHPKTKLFISHCGLLSSIEAIWYGIPVLGAPIFADQFLNAHLLLEAGLGEKFNVADFTTKEIKNLILKILKNPKYSENAEMRSNLLRNQPDTALEKALWWIDFLLRNPDVEFLQSKSKGMDVLILHSVDTIAFLLTSFLIFVFMIYKLCCCFPKYIFSKKNFRKLKEE